MVLNFSLAFWHIIVFCSIYFLLHGGLYCSIYVFVYSFQENGLTDPSPLIYRKDLKDKNSKAHAKTTQFYQCLGRDFGIVFFDKRRCLLPYPNLQNIYNCLEYKNR